jgi:DNA-binding NtrC family response regulator
MRAWPALLRDGRLAYPRSVSDDFDHDDLVEASTVLHPRLDVSPTPDRTFVLEVIEGPNRGTVFRIDPLGAPTSLVGQGPLCALRLSDPAVSRRHASIEPVGPRLRIRDLESKNGTRVDGLAIAEVYLVGGEIVRLGDSAFRVRLEAGAIGPPLPTATDFENVIGASTEMRRLYPMCEKLASSNLSIILEGETGTGKEALAEAIHARSARKDGPFVVFDCTAVPAELLEAELFGHEKGAFTGAVGSRRGVFEQADGGTLLIDEIGDLDLHLQPKLLRAIERSEVRRLGSEAPIRVNARIIAATRRDLDREVQAGRFRDDLFHRLAMARIELPPLRRRVGDIRMLARHFASGLGGDPDALPQDLIRRWEDYAWPGNVRELRNAVARHLALGELSEAVAAPAANAAASSDDPISRILELRLPLAEARRRLLEIFEERYIERVLRDNDGHIGRAAAASGVARRYFQILRARSAG